MKMSYLENNFINTSKPWFDDIQIIHEYDKYEEFFIKAKMTIAEQNVK